MNIKLRVDFLSKTKSQITSEEVIIFEFIKPGRTIKFKEKVSWPKEAESFSLTLVDTKVE